MKALEQAGAFAAEIEVVPDRITSEIAKRTSLVLFSMGAGTGGDAQYLFSTDILGYSDWWTPRHSKQYRDFRAEYARLQAERDVGVHASSSPTCRAASTRNPSTSFRSPTTSTTSSSSTSTRLG